MKEYHIKFTEYAEENWNPNRHLDYICMAPNADRAINQFKDDYKAYNNPYVIFIKQI